MVMDPISMMLLLWAANKSGGGGAAAAKPGKKKSAPSWPTPKSPPPLPAFQPRSTPTSADPGGTSTPLSVLHQSPPTPPSAHASPIEQAKHAATAAIRKRTTALLARQAATLNPFAKKAAPATSTALVSNLQKILTTHGVKIATDGLYGPKTASAWAALAKRKGLAPTISREGPKIAKVATQTFEQLSVPPIP